MSGAADALFHAHLGLCRRVVIGLRRARGAQRGVTAEEEEADALLGLWDAARRYDPALGVPFGLYAQRRVAGAVLDGRRARGGRGTGAAPRGLQLSALARPDRECHRCRWEARRRELAEDVDDLLADARLMGPEARRGAAVLRLRVVEGVEAREAAARLGVSPSRASQMQRAYLERRAEAGCRGGRRDD